MTKTVYSDELLDKVREYMQKWPEIPLKSGRKRMIPGKEGLAQYLGIGRQTLYDLCDEKNKERYAELHALVDEMMGEQREELENGGLSKDMDNKTVALLLSRHGVVMKKELDHTSSDKSMSPQASGDAVLEALNRKHAADN